MLSPGSAKTFLDYCSAVLWPFVKRLLQSVQRIDIVFDRYMHTSLKSETRESRGSGQKINVRLNTVIPKTFSKFLAVADNKQQLFRVIADFFMSQPTDHKVLICTVEDRACTSHTDYDISSISPCTAEEADGRLLLHAKHAAENGCSNVTVRTVDSDVVVIATYAYRHIAGMKRLWIDFGVGKSRKLIPVHDLCTVIPESVISNLPFFHAFTGCDTVSAFCGIGKLTAWRAWMSFRDVDASFHTMSTAAAAAVIDNSTMRDIERYVVLMYDRTSSCTTVNECRRILYTRKNRAIENIPPTADALLQHSKRAALQAHIWQVCLSATTPSYDPAEWGWKVGEDGRYAPVWCSIPDISMHCTELVRCSCTTVCRNCKCRKNELRCTKLCACDAQCSGQTFQKSVSEAFKEDRVEAYDILLQDIEEDAEADNVLDILFDDTDSFVY